MRQVAAMLLLSLPLFAQSTLSPRVEIALPDVVQFHTELDPQLRWGKGKGFKVSASKLGELRFIVDKQQYVGWTTQCIRVGDDAIVDDKGEFSMRSEPRLVEYDRGGGIVERYELRAEGVEQSWVIAKRPDGEGDLVVEGAISGGLTARRDFNSGGHEFVDQDGVAFVRYGVATAIDGQGVKTKLQVRADDGVVSIVVPNATWSKAAFPLTIDPLFAPARLAPAPRYSHVHVARDSSRRKICIVAQSRPSGGDSDVYVWTCNDDFTGVQLVFARVSDDDDWSSGVAAVASQGRFCVVVVSSASHAHSGRGICYFHDSHVTAFEGGRIAALPIDVMPIGGDRVAGSLTTGTHALCIVRTRVGLTNGWAALRLDAARQVVLARTVLPGFANPTLTRNAASMDDPWVIVSGRRDFLRYWSSGRTESWASTDTRFVFERVDGADGVYGLAARSTVTLRPLMARMEWTSSMTTPRITRYGRSFETLSVIAWDRDSRSHWIARTSTRAGSGFVTAVTRIGGDLQPVESHSVTSWAQEFTFDDTNRRFVVISSDGPTIWARHLSHDWRTVNRYLGSSCGITISANHPPYAGSSFYEVRGSTSRNGWHVLYISRRANTRYNAIGSCPLFVDLAAPYLIDSVLVRRDATSTLRHRLPLPSDPALHGSLFMQWINWGTRETSNMLWANIWP